MGATGRSVVRQRWSLTAASIDRQDKRWSWVHVDDLAEAYLLAANNRGNAAGQLFSIGEGDGPTYETLLRTLKGYDGECRPEARARAVLCTAYRTLPVAWFVGRRGGVQGGRGLWPLL